MDNGVQLPYIQALLGHKDIKTTMIYTHVTNGSITNVASPLDSLRLSIKKP
jgi:site-specific recombinase XerD